MDLEKLVVKVSRFAICRSNFYELTGCVSFKCYLVRLRGLREVNVRLVSLEELVVNVNVRR